MMDEKTPWLARKLLWIDKKGSVDRIFWTLALLCVGLGLADFFYHKHVRYDVESWPAIYGVIGFTVYATVVFLAKGLRLIVKRREDYYTPYAIDIEDERAAGADGSAESGGATDA